MSKNSRQSKNLPLSVSQNFLTSSRTIQRLLRLASINKNAGFDCAEAGEAAAYQTVGAYVVCSVALPFPMLL